MRFLMVFMALGLLLAGCPGDSGSGVADVDEGLEAPEPAEESPLPAEEAEETPEEVAAEPEEEPEIAEEEIVHWGVGVTEEDEDEGHRQLQAVEFDGYALIVDDITDDYPEPCAAIRVGELGGTYIETLFQDKVCPGESTYWTSPEGDEYRIKVFETAAGYQGYEYWADVAVYKQG
ncbi:hypothetical protein GF412_05245 [Candidatus Micrarchaeota archaeon]|nr:hypothetical protein [Candidatus Micrarchaeota archaeon]MBD3418359.1 hypothetical protein [Candidatus Micrarchaeota archaeon]